MGSDDPLFPSTALEQSADRLFQARGIARRWWETADAARKIFKQAFEAIGLPGFNPHSFRHALAMLGERVVAHAGGIQGVQPEPRARARFHDALKLRRGA